MFSLTLALLQLCLSAVAFAAPISAMGDSSSMQYGAGGGVLGFVVLILDIIVWGKHERIIPVIIGEHANITTIVEVLKSNRPPSHKLLWSVLVFIFPIFGIVIYWLFSDRQKWNNGAGYEPIVEA
jgi:hypothetical protein